MTDEELGNAIYQMMRNTRREEGREEVYLFPGTVALMGKCVRTILAAERQHTSDCAVHRGPDYQPGPCDCGAERPQVTREAVQEWASEWLHKTPISERRTNTNMIMDALSHFAPPREARPIDGMSVEEIRKEFPEPYPDVPRNRSELMAIINCILDTNARVAHRLAQPVPVVDPDAEARALFEELKTGGWTFNGHLLWDWSEAPKEAQEFCRKWVAKRAAAKEAGRKDHG